MFDQEYMNAFQACSAQALAESRSAIRMKKEQERRERIEDAANFVKKADENLVAVLSNDSTFGLQDRIAYFKRKWIKEHKVLILFGIILWCLLFAFGIYGKQPIVLGLLPMAGLIIYGYIRNQMMIYVEDRAFVK